MAGSTQPHDTGEQAERARETIREAKDAAAAYERGQGSPEPDPPAEPPRDEPGTPY